MTQNFLVIKINMYCLTQLSELSPFSWGSKKGKWDYLQNRSGVTICIITTSLLKYNNISIFKNHVKIKYI